MGLYNSRGNIRVSVNDTTMPFGLYAADGSLRVKVVSGSTNVGLYAPDGAFNVVVVTGADTNSGVYHPSGALRGIAATSETGATAPNGAIYFSGLSVAASLSADAGTYIITGSTSSTYFNRFHSAGNGSYTLSGTAASFTYYAGPLSISYGTITFTEDAQPYTMTGSEKIVVADDNDTLGADYRLTLILDNGDLTLSGTTGLVFSVGDGTADTNMTFVGTIANINTALDGAQINNCTTGSATLTIPFTNETTSTTKSKVMDFTVDPALPSGLLYYGDLTNYMQYDVEYVTYG